MARLRAGRFARLSPEDELALLLCGTRAHRTARAARIAELARHADHVRLAETFETLQVLTLAGCRLAAYGADEPPPFRAGIDGAADRIRLQALFFDAANGAILAALEGAGIPALPLKGPTLAARIYEDRGLRRYNDLDVLVPAEQLHAAVEVVRGLGYAAPPDLGNPGLPELHYELYHPEDRLPPVELHWRVHWLEERFSRDLLARSTPGGEARTAQPTDELVALLLFYSRDGFTGLKLLADIAAWWDRYGDDGFDGKDFAALLGEHPALAPACAAANMVAAPLIGLPTLAQRGDRRTTLAVRLANWNLSGDIDQIKANVTLVDGLLAPKGTIGAFVRRHLLLSRERLEDYYHLPPRAGLRRLVWKVVHPPKTLLRYAVALATLLRRRSWSPGAEMAHS